MKKFLDHAQFAQQSLYELQQLGENLDHYEQNHNPELMQKIFKSIHFIKSTAALLNLKHIEKFSGKIEDVVDFLRNKVLPFDVEISDALKSSFSVLVKIFDHIENSETVDLRNYHDLLQSFIEKISENQEMNKTKIKLDNEFIYEFDIHVTRIKHYLESCFLYILDIDMIEDLEDKKIQPNTFINSLNDLGDLLDCQFNIMDVPDNFDEKSVLPLKILYATTMKKEIVSYALNISEEKITPISSELIMNFDQSAQLPIREEIEDISLTNDSTLNFNFNDTQGVSDSLAAPQAKFDERSQKPVHANEKENKIKDHQNIQAEPGKTDFSPAAYQTNSQEYILFLIDGNPFAVDVLKVLEIIRYQKLSKIPNMPPFIKGMINLRGTIIPVIDLRKVLKYESIQLTSFNIIIIVKIKEKKIGIIVDNVLDLIIFKQDDLQKEVVEEIKIDEKFIEGLFKYQEQMICCLDIEKLIELIFEELKTK